MKVVGWCEGVMLLLIVSGCDGGNETKKPSPEASAAATVAVTEQKKPIAATTVPSEARDAPKEVVTKDVTEGPEVVYERKRSELYDLVEGASEALNNLRHQENFNRTYQRLSQFTANLSPQAEKTFTVVVDRVNEDLTTLLIYNHAVVSRASAVMGMEAELAGRVMKGSLPEAPVRAAYREILAGFGQISAYMASDFSEHVGTMWNYFTDWELQHWDWAESAKTQDLGNGLQMPRMPHMSTDEWPKNLCSRDDWNGAVFVVGSFAKARFLRGTLTAGDLFVELATIRLCERWFTLAEYTDRSVEQLAGNLPEDLASRIPGSGGVTESRRAQIRAQIAEDATFLEDLLEEKLMTYPWPWPVPAKVSHFEAPPSPTATVVRQSP